MSAATAIRALVTWLVVCVVLVFVLGLFGGVGQYELLLVALVSAGVTVVALRRRRGQTRA